VNYATVDDNKIVNVADIGILIGAGTGIRVRGNRWDNISLGIQNNATGAVLSDNVGW
jgi:hypothetical protein